MLNKKQMFCLVLFSVTANATTSDAALAVLKKGNIAFVKHPDHSAKRKELTPKQKPIAVIVGCSDSRTTPSKIFNQLSLGKLFEIRNAGNIADCTAIGSIEYAVKHLKTPLVVVLGHQNCGAVEAALESHGHSEAYHPECIQSIIDNINTNSQLASLKEETDKAKLLESAVKSNVCQTVNNIKYKSNVIKNKIASRQLQIVGAYYNFNGQVEWLECDVN
jgi:carbonic anhydrase